MNEKNVARTFIGLIVTFIVLSILFSDNGSLSDGITFVLVMFVFSIVCTLGIGLAFWIPLWLGVGHIIFEIVGWARKKFETKPAREAQASKSQAKPSPTWEQKIMLNYIKKARARGLNDELISQNLTNNGWTVGEIKWAFDALK